MTEYEADIGEWESGTTHKTKAKTPAEALAHFCTLGNVVQIRELPSRIYVYDECGGFCDNEFAITNKEDR